MNTSEERVYTPSDLARRWKVDPKSVANRFRRGELAGFRVGRLLRFTAQAVRDFENRQMDTGATKQDLE